MIGIIVTSQIKNVYKQRLVLIVRLYTQRREMPPNLGAGGHPIWKELFRPDN